MSDGSVPGGGFCFGSFELRLHPRELFKDGVRIRLQEKPFQVLELLAEKAGTTVSREELRHRLWSEDTHVEFEANLYTALAKVRQALDESAENPRFIETVSRMGYRFTAAVQAIENGNGAPVGCTPAPPPDKKKGVAAAAGSERAPAAHPPARTRRSWLIISAVIAAALLFPYAIRRFTPALEMGSAHKTVLVVLPFANLSEDPHEESASDKLTQELIQEIGASNSEKLRVISPPFGMHDKGERESMKQISNELGADFVLDGSVRRESGQVQVTASLVRARTRTRLWMHSYDGNSSDLTQVEHDVARNVTDAMANEVRSGPPTAASQTGKQNSESYQAYLEGRLSWNNRSRSSLQRAEKLFARSVLSDPQFALGYAGLADTYLVLTDWQIESPNEGYEHARQAAQKALALNDSLGSAHAVLASVSWQHERAWPQAEAEFRLAISFDPANATIHQWYAEALGTQGRTAESLSEIRRAHELDPLSRSVVGEESNLLYMARRYDQAIVTAKELAQMDPAFPPAYILLSHGYLATGKYAAAVNAHLKYLELNGAPEANRADLLRAMESGGIRSVWKRFLEDLKQRETREYISPMEEAVLEIRLGEYQAALTDLEKSYAIGEGMLEWIKVDPALDPLRQEPRFKKLLERMHVGS